ncbi:MAG: serine/threonine-protein phosphatase [Myxococcales bacterium]|nr:serine/threonine-protein phosphatase [Myxococcales bacterium]
MQFTIEWAADSNTGRQRDHNEDSFLADDAEGIWVVADGMGGHNSGEEASQLAVSSIHHYITELQFIPENDERLAQMRGVPRLAAAMVEAIRHANDRIFIEAMRNAAKQGMGTTVVAAKRDGTNLVLGSVGDSRIYRLRGNSLTQVTIDHTLVNHLVHTKGMSLAEAQQMAQSNVIVRALGLKNTVEVDVRYEPLRDGDIYLLCSDGLTDMVADNVVGQVMVEGSRIGLPSICQNLIAHANNNGGRDNITVCVLRVVAS